MFLIEIAFVEEKLIMNDNLWDQTDPIRSASKKRHEIMELGAAHYDMRKNIFGCLSFILFFTSNIH